MQIQRVDIHTLSFLNSYYSHDNLIACIGNDVTTLGAYVFSEALKCNRSLTELDLRGKILIQMNE